MTVSDRSLYMNWKPVSVVEMKGFIAVILNMGIVQLANLKDYWSTELPLLLLCVLQGLVPPDLWDVSRWRLRQWQEAWENPAPS